MLRRAALLLAVLLCAAGQASADWTFVTRSVEASVSYDKLTVKKSPNGVTLWTMTNFVNSEVLNGKSYRSAKAQFEFDCPRDRYRVTGTLLYELPNGAGKVIDSTSMIEQWNPIAPQTMARLLQKLACKA